MSERGSFVTEYIYCDECLKAVAGVLLKDGKYLRGIQVPSWSGGLLGVLPIIAGKVGGLSRCEEIAYFRDELCPQIEKAICHPVRIAVLAECGQKIFNLRPHDLPLR